MKRGISQETLKLIACITMLIDHIGAVLVPWMPLRVIGRLSFPIFCFLISEGVFHTRKPWKYALRLGVCALLSEIPFDYCFFGRINWGHQNVMITLLLGFCALYAGKYITNFWMKILAAAPFVAISAVTDGDYGVRGVLLILLFGLTREFRLRPLVQLVGIFLIFFDPHGWPLFRVLGTSVTLQMTCVAAMIPIALYSGEKLTHNRFIQWGFYLFYPVHLLVLWLIR